MPSGCLLAVLCLLLASPAWADIVYLKNGNRFDGRIVAEDETSVTLETPAGRITLQRRQIERIVEEDDSRELRRELRRAMGRGDFDRAIGLARLGARTANPSERETDLADALLEIARMQRESWHLLGAGRTLDVLQREVPSDALPPAIQDQITRLRQQLADATGETGAILERARRSLDPGDALFAPREGRRLLARMVELDTAEGRELRVLYSAALALEAAPLVQADALGALVQLREIPDLHPDADPTAVRLYVAARVIVAREAFERGENTDADRHLDAAFRIDPANEQALLMRGQFRHMRGDLRAAMTDYLRVLDEDSGGRRATPELCQELRQRCLAEGTHSLDLRPLATRMTRTPDADAELLAKTVGEVTVRATDEELIQRLHEIVDSQWERLVELFELRRSRTGQHGTSSGMLAPLELVVFPTEVRFHEAVGKEQSLGGYTQFALDARGRLHYQRILTFAQAAGLKEDVLPHELAHVLIGGFLGHDVPLPRWLHEGLAAVAESRPARAERRRVVREADAADVLLDLHLVMSSVDYPGEPEDMELFYSQSYALVEFLQDRHGWPKVWAFAAGFTGGFEAAYAGAFGESFEPTEFERDWRRWLRR